MGTILCPPHMGRGRRKTWEGMRKGELLEERGWSRLTDLVPPGTITELFGVQSTPPSSTPEEQLMKGLG